jgi:hypothetical protein
MEADGKRPRTVGGYIETLDKLLAMFPLAKGPSGRAPVPGERPCGVVSSQRWKWPTKLTRHGEAAKAAARPASASPSSLRGRRAGRTR